MIPDGNLEFHKEMKNIRNDKCVSKCKIIFLIFKLFKNEFKKLSYLFKTWYVLSTMFGSLHIAFYFILLITLKSKLLSSLFSKEVWGLERIE